MEKQICHCQKSISGKKTIYHCFPSSKVPECDFFKRNGASEKCFHNERQGLDSCTNSAAHDFVNQVTSSIEKETGEGTTGLVDLFFITSSNVMQSGKAHLELSDPDDHLFDLFGYPLLMVSNSGQGL